MESLGECCVEILAPEECLAKVVMTRVLLCTETVAANGTAVIPIANIVVTISVVLHLNWNAVGTQQKLDVSSTSGAQTVVTANSEIAGFTIEKPFDLLSHLIIWHDTSGFSSMDDYVCH